jgi:hypothetical protein
LLQARDSLSQLRDLDVLGRRAHEEGSTTARWGRIFAGLRFRRERRLSLDTSRVTDSSGGKGRPDGRLPRSGLSTLPTDRVRQVSPAGSRDTAPRE